MPNLSINLTEDQLRTIAREEAALAVGAAALQVLQAKVKGRRDGTESAAVLAIRASLAAHFNKALSTAAQNEERQVATVAKVVDNANGPALDQVGAVAGVTRNADEGDTDFRERIKSNNDLEAKEIRKVLTTAGRNLAEALLESGPVRKLLREVVENFTA